MPVPSPPPSTSPPSDVHMVFSGNWAAVVGLILCIAILLIWIDVQFQQDEEDDLG